MQSAKRKRFQKDCAPADDIITLINLVRENPALYNYKLQPNQRRRADVLNGWAQIAIQIGNKYTVEECRRKWKNLRDTYHQYRLRKPKLGDNLAKWRYAKELDFLSSVYQPKLKSQRNQTHVFDANTSFLLHDDIEDDSEVTTHHRAITKHSKHRHHHQHHVHGHHHHHHHHTDDDHDQHSDNGIDGHHPSSITLVHGDTESFILTAYEDVNGDIDHDGPHMELHSVVEDVTGEIVKSEHAHQLDDDDGVSAEVDYEEVCLYEEAGNAPSADCETIITGPGGATVVTSAGVDVTSVRGGSSPSPSDTKDFQYIDNDFCIESTINGHDDLQSPTGNVTVPGSIITTTTDGSGGNGGSLTKLKNVSVVTTNTSVVDATTGQPTTVTVFTTTAPSMLETTTGSLKIHNMVGSPAATLVQHEPTVVGTNAHVTDSGIDTTGTSTTTTLLTVPTSPNGATTSAIFNTNSQTREELDLFFDFLKKKMQSFPREDITSIQVEFLNCVLRREAEQKTSKIKY